MRVYVIRTVPGLTEQKHLTAGTRVELSDGLAISLIQDGYAEVVAETPAERREVATAGRGPGRPRKAV